jgi:tryptophanyl-tRNA synthetase
VDVKRIPEVNELAFLLATVTNMGLLERAVSYKDKVDRGIGFIRRGHLNKAETF